VYKTNTTRAETVVRNRKHVPEKIRKKLNSTDISIIL